MHFVARSTLRTSPGLAGFLLRTAFGLAGVLAAFSSAPASAVAPAWECADAGKAESVCGQAACDDEDGIHATDALAALRAAVGSGSCSSCRCDTDRNGLVAATDSLRILRVAVGQDVALGCPACNSLNIIATATTTDVPAGVVLTKTGDDGFLALNSTEDAIISRRFDGNLVLEQGPDEIAMSSAPGSSFLACNRQDGSIVTAWPVGMEMNAPAPHDYPDLANVVAAFVDAAGESTPTFPVHPVRNGYQRPLAVFCEPSGGATILWYSWCRGIRTISEGVLTDFAPPNCPLNGFYLRRFDAGGNSVGDELLLARTFTWYPGWSETIRIPANGFAIDSRERFLVFDDDGNLLSDSTVFGNITRRFHHDCSAGSDRCVSVAEGGATVHASLTPEAASFLLVKETIYPDDPVWDIEIGPRGSTLSCDTDGICIAAWFLVEERENYSDEGDFYDSETLGIFGRAFNAKTGELGPEIELENTGIRNIGPGRFVTATAGEPGKTDTTRLRLLVVQ